MKHISSILVAATGLAMTALVHAQVTVKDAWVRATVPQQKASGAFMQLTANRDVRLVEARSPVAGVVEIHESSMEGGTMRMRAVNAIELPAGRSVDLKPGGYHVMLMALKQQIKEGETVPITLVVEGKDGKRENVEVKAPVRALTSGSAGGAHKGH